MVIYLERTNAVTLMYNIQTWEPFGGGGCCCCFISAVVAVLLVRNQSNGTEIAVTLQRGYRSLELDRLTLPFEC